MIFQNVLELLEDQGHAERVSQLAYRLSRTIGLKERESELISRASRYHDIGKIVIPRKVLQLQTPLSEMEYKMVQRHVQFGLALMEVHTGEEILLAKSIIATHHEHWDGCGYPNGLKGEDIPICGRIVALCDVFDALRSERPYKKPWPLDWVLEFISVKAGKQFDPNLAEQFISMDGIY
jgi:putative two-component system response regulator